MSKPLYELTEQMKGLEKLADSGGMDVDTIEDTMAGIEASFEEKAVSIVHVGNRMLDTVDAIDKEVKRLGERKKYLQNREKSLKDYLMFHMEKTGTTKIECDLFTITYVQGKPVVVIDNADDVPPEYLNIKTTMTPDKKEIAKALKEGKDLENALNDFSNSMNNSKVLIAHNINFDEKIIGAEFLRKNVNNNLDKINKFCTMKTTTNYCKLLYANGNGNGYKWPKLTELHIKLFDEDFSNAHDALADVKACARCFFELKNKNIIYAN